MPEEYEKGKVESMYQKSERHESREDYLEAIWLISKERGSCRSINVADHLGFSKPSVSVAVSKLAQEGYIIFDSDKLITLTPLGREVAEETYAKHHFFKSMLIKAGVDEETAETEACAMEHTISSDSFRKMKAFYPVA